VNPRDRMPFDRDQKIRELLDGQARQTAEIIGLGQKIDASQSEQNRVIAEQGAALTELRTESAGNKKVGRIAAWAIGVFGMGLVGAAATYVTTTIRLEERQGAAERAIEAVQARSEREAEKTRVTLEGVREALVDLRAEQRALRDRFDRIERERNEVRRNR
jgi:hypothetical protein